MAVPVENFWWKMLSLSLSVSSSPCIVCFNYFLGFFAEFCYDLPSTFVQYFISFLYANGTNHSLDGTNRIWPTLQSCLFSLLPLIHPLFICHFFLSVFPCVSSVNLTSGQLPSCSNSLFVFLFAFFYLLLCFPKQLLFFTYFFSLDDPFE